jgi:hypothetical protein
MQLLERVPARRVDEPQPFRRDELVLGNKFVRLILARTLGQVANLSPHSVAIDRWPNDAVLDLTTRAASAPAMTTVPGWAAELAQKVLVDAVDALGPMSAGVQLMKKGLLLNFNGAGELSVPTLVAAASNASFIQEGAAIPMRQLSTAAVSLLPYKIGSIAALTLEMLESSNAERLIIDTLLRSAGAALDAALFDASAATAARPAGLRYNIAALTASANANPDQAFFEDVTTLTNAVATVGGQGPYGFIASPGRSISIRTHLLIGDVESVPTGSFVLGTPAVGNDVLAVVPSAVAAALDTEPDIAAGPAATLVMDDTAPVPPDTTQPTQSMWQQASIALRMRQGVTWALRDSRGVAWLTPSWQ